MSYNVRWGIIGPGGISSTFVSDLLMPTSIHGRDPTLVHTVVAVGSRDLSRAQRFVEEKVKGRQVGECRALEGYEGVYEDPEISVVYVGTTHTQHYEQTKAALLAGKHVLCEKPFTTTAREAHALISLAREKGLFLMEAVWTRYQPLVREVEDRVKGGKIGEVRRIFADLGWNADVENLPGTSRVISPELAGGALLDLGPYPLLWPLLLIPGASDHPPSSISASIQKTNLKSTPTQVDAQTSFTLNYDEAGAQAILSCSITSETHSPTSVIVHGTKGTIVLEGPCFRPDAYTLTLYPTARLKQPPVAVRVEASIEGRGMYWMGDEVGRCLKEGRLESERCGWGVMARGMKVFDEVRRQGGYDLREREL